MARNHDQLTPFLEETSNALFTEVEHGIDVTPTVGCAT
jgi:hypothetical protein